MPEANIKDIFVECQKGLHGHASLIKTLLKIYQGLPVDEFWEEFQHYIKYFMVIYRRDPPVERAIDFIAKFVVAIGQKQTKDDESEECDEASCENDLLERMFDFILKSHKASDKAVRFRSCQLVNILLHSMGDGAQIDDDLYERIYEAMLERMRDKFPLVRAQAVWSLSRLQDPSDNDCPVINAYLFLLSCDPNPDVRRAVLTCIAASTTTLPSLLERTRDVKDVVRKLAFSVISEKVHIKALTIAQRIKLLKDGLNDKAEGVRDACINKMLQSWLKMFAGNILELLDCLDVEDSPDTVEKALVCLFKRFPASQLVEDFDLLNDKNVVDIPRLTCESAFYWRCLCHYLKSLGSSADDLLEKMVPTTFEYSQYLHRVVKAYQEIEKDLDIQLQQEYILGQLLDLAGSLDISDEAGRKGLEKLVQHLLVSEQTTHGLVKPLIGQLVRIQTNDRARIESLVETIADIRQPITLVETGPSPEERRQIDMKIAAIRVKLMELRESLEESINTQKFSDAAQIKETMMKLEEDREKLEEDNVLTSQEVRTDKNDPQTLLKCLIITSEMLQDVQMSSLTPSLQMLLETLIIPGIQNEDPAIRNVSVKCLGLCCQMSKVIARSHFLLLMQVSQVDTIAVQVSALRAIFDLLQTFGLEAFEAEENRNKEIEKEKSKQNDSLDDMFGSATSPTNSSSDRDFVDDNDDDETSSQDNLTSTASSLVTILTGLLDSENTDIRTVTAEGMCKLLLSGRIVSAKLFSRLLLLWYNPITEDDNHLRQCLGTFFPVYAFSRRSHQHIIEEAFLPTLKTLFNAPTSSPLCTVNVNNVSELLMQLTSSQHLVEKVNNNTTVDPQDCSLHSSMAIKVCNEILTEPNSFNVRCLVRILGLLEYSHNQEMDNKHLMVLAEQMSQKVKDKTSLKTIDKFQRLMASFVKGENVTETTITEQQTEKTNSEDNDLQIESQESRSSVMEQDVQTIMENRRKSLSRSRSGKRGKRKLQSFETVEIETASSLNEDTVGESELENSVFMTPGPVRRSSRHTKVNSPKMNLDSLLSSASDDVDSPVKGRSKRNTRAAAKVLSGIENEVN